MSKQLNDGDTASSMEPDTSQDSFLHLFDPSIVVSTGVQNLDSASAEPISKLERVRSTLTLPGSSRTRCRVPGCLIKNCNLGTHQRYRPINHSWTRADHKLNAKASRRLKQLQSWTPQSPSSDGVDGFPKLPLQETLEVTTRSLFHYFFTEAFDRLALLFRGPSVGSMVYFKDRMLTAALQSEVYCRALILQASNERDSNAHEELETKEALNLYSNTIVALREQVGTIRQHPHPVLIELSILVICILVMFDIAHGHEDALQVHWQGLRDLINMRGGIHCVSTALAYAIHADLACAIVFRELPIFLGGSIQMRPTLIPPIPSPGVFRHGAYFDNFRRGSRQPDVAVIDYVEEVSELVGLWAPSRIHSREDHGRSSAASVYYLHYTRERLHERFAVLNARWAKTNSIERCLLYASRIVEYPVTWSNYIPALTRLQCERLAAFLQEQELDDMVYESADVLMWMLFALITIHPSYEPQSWAVQYMQNKLTVKYGAAPWRPMWWAEEQENLLGFTWSSPYYGDRFTGVCHELERLSCGEFVHDNDRAARGG